MRNDQLYLLAGALQAQGKFVERYRAGNGQKCVVGMLIESHAYTPDIEGNSVAYLLDNFDDVADSIKKYQGTMSDFHFDRFLMELQDYNDSYKGTTVHFKDVYQDFCEIRSKYPH